MSDVKLGEERFIPRSRDPLRIDNKDPKLRYLWANKKLVEDNKSDGWVILNKTQGDKAKGTSDPRDKSPDQMDGTIQRRDAIVMVIPEEIARERFDKPLEELNRIREGAFKRTFAEEARREGLIPFDESRESR